MSATKVLRSAQRERDRWLLRALSAAWMAECHRSHENVETCLGLVRSLIWAGRRLAELERGEERQPLPQKG